MQNKQRQKFIGYFLRITSIIIWGFTSIFGRYYLSHLPSEFILSFSFLIGAFFLASITGIVKIYKYCSQGKITKRKTGSLHSSFWIAIIADGFTTFFVFWAVKYTYSSNAKLFLNFAPVVALLATLFFLKKKERYFRNKKSTVTLICFFVLGCIGASLLVSIKTTTISLENKFLGDSIAFLALVADVIGTLALIHYSKLPNSYSGLEYGFRKVSFQALLTIPITIYYIDYVASFSSEVIFAFLCLGILDMGLAYIFAYLAYQRLDGLIVYLLYNISAIVTVLVEIIFFKLPVSTMFIVGAVMIITSSVVAEIINSKAEKQAN